MVLNKINYLFIAVVLYLQSRVKAGYYLNRIEENKERISNILFDTFCRASLGDDGDFVGSYRTIAVKNGKECETPECTEVRDMTVVTINDAAILESLSVFYDKADWSPCTRSCKTKRKRKCRLRTLCQNTVINEEAICYFPNTKCEKKIEEEMELEIGFASGDDGSGSIRDDDNMEDNDFVFDDNMYRSSDHDFGWVNWNDTSEPEDSDIKLIKFESSEVCGKRLVKTSSYREKIIGGMESPKGAWPWQVALFDSEMDHVCGGILISDQWVLTAAHCIINDISVRIAEHHFTKKEKTEAQIEVAFYIKHPEFDKETYDNDMGLLKLKRKIKFGKYIQPACLPINGTPVPTDQRCVITGWGKRKETHIFGADVLHYAVVPVVNYDECKENLENYVFTENMFCAGYLHGGIDSCHGDSGGPLICRGKNDTWTAQGIVSHGIGCGAGYFGVYTKVSNYIEWIIKTVDFN